MNELLTLQQEAFCKLYALYGKGGGTRAAKEAGYSNKSAKTTASQLLKDQRIQKRIEVERGEVKNKVDMTTKEVIERFQDIARRHGDYTNASVKDSSEALKQIGKYLQMQGFADKIIVEREVPFKNWLLEEINEYNKTGKVPKGKRLPDLQGLGEIIVAGKPPLSGTGEAGSESE